MYFDNKFEKRESVVRKSLEIDDTLYTRLKEYTKIYNANVSDLIGACIENLLNAPKLPIYEAKNPLYVMHTIRIKESHLDALGDLKVRYGISIFRLINTAIEYTFDDN